MDDISLSGMFWDIARATADPTPPREDLSHSPGEPDTDLVMSNFDGRIEDGLEAALREGKIGSHTAWDFFGRVWFADGLFHEEVWRYRVPQKVHSAASLQELMEQVNNEWGWK